MKNPCKDCTDREISCHAECQKYLEWKKVHDEEKSKVYEQKRHVYEKVDYLMSKKGKRR